MFDRRSALASLVAVTTVLTVTALPASAAKQRFRDAANDAHDGIDIRAVRVVNEDGIRVVTTLDRFRNRGVDSTEVAVYFDTNRRDYGPEYFVGAQLFTWELEPPSRIDGWRDRSPRTLSNCRWHLKTETGGYVTFYLARDCFRNINKVRVSVVTGDGRGANDWSPRHRTFHSAVAYR